MKKILILVTGFLFYIPAAHAQIKSLAILHLSGGITRPVAPEHFTSDWKVGVSFDGGLEFRVIKQLAVRFNLSYNSIPLDQDKVLKRKGFLESGFSLVGGKTTIYLGSVNLKLRAISFAGKISAYGAAGVGFFNRQTEGGFLDIVGGPQLVEEVSEFTTGAIGGVGIEYFINDNLALFIEGDYLMGMTGEEDTICTPLKVGLAIGM